MNSKNDIQFDVRCSHCGKPFAIVAEQGRTLKTRCPYCGSVMTIATPLLAQQQAQPAMHQPEPRRRPVTRREQDDTPHLKKWTTVVFVIVLVLVILTLITLYIIFTSLSK